MFASLQHEFAAALLDADAPVPDALTAHTGHTPHKRFAVYRNNVAVGLVHALRARFPAVERIVGEEFFFGMARLFVVAHPPRSKILCEYGEDFPDFIAGFPPAAELVYLADIARLEAARTHACHAADAEPLPPQAFAAIASERLGDIRIALHPSMQIVRSRHPVVTIWAMNAGEREPAPVDENEAQDALVSRPDMQVHVALLPPGAADFLSALAGGRSLGDAARNGAGRDPRFDLTASLALLFSSRLPVAVPLSGEPA